MSLIIKEEIKELFLKDNPIIINIDQFRKLIDISNLTYNEIIFESFVMINDSQNYFQLSIYTNYFKENINIQIRLDLKYHLNPVMYLFQNIINSNYEDNFWTKIYNINIIKYISKNKLKPFDISFLEIKI